MKMPLIIALILGLVAAGVWWLYAANHHSRQENMVEFESDTTEGLLRVIIQELDAENPRFYFIAFGKEGTDPSRLFIARFASHVPSVRVASAAFTLRNGKLQETASGRSGETIQIIRVKKIKDGIAEGLVRFANLPAGQNQFTYRIAEEDGKWILK